MNPPQDSEGPETQEQHPQSRRPAAAGSSNSSSRQPSRSAQPGPSRPPAVASQPSVATRDSSPSATVAEMPQYTSRDMGDPSQIRRNKQSMADLKLRRLTELNSRLKEDLERERIPVSQASKSIIAYCNSTRDYMVPSVWGVVPKGEDPYAPQQNGGCCLVM
ncbi:hypothetical protein RB594_002921 [Gaeumannomyces avenae]